MLDFSVKVYRHLKTTTHAAIFSKWMATWTEMAKNIRFSTRNPGGFAECSFSIDATYDEALDIYQSYHHNYIVLEEGGGDIIWRGRIHEITLEPGQVSITAYGLWSNTFDTVYDMDYFMQVPSAENSILNLTGYLTLSDTYEAVAQSFQITEERAIQDIQVRLRNSAELDEGSVTITLCENNAGVPGTVLSTRVIEAASIETTGFSEYIGLTTTARLSANTTYWIKIDGGSPVTAIEVGIDTGANYGGGKLRYYDDSTWYDYSPSADMIFYVWQHQRFNYSTGTNSSAKDVILDAVSECALLNAEFSIILDDGISVVNPIVFNSGEKPGDVIEKVASYGSSGSTPEPLFVGIYDSNGSATRGPMLHIRKCSQGRKWYIDISDLAFGQQGMSITSSLDGMRTRTAVIYSDSVGSRSATTWISNQEYTDRFGYSRDGLFSIAGASEDVADLVGQVVASSYGRPQAKLSLLVDGFVHDMAMKKCPVWKVRAGDILKIKNLFPTSTTLSSAIADGLSTIYIQETEYEAETGRMTITPSDMNRSLLDIVLALAGLGGGSLV